MFRPNYYDYCRKTESLKADEDDTNCPICFEDLSISLDQDCKGEFVNDSFMETPCKHRFHDHCLKTWMDEKFLCPCCR